jgi:TPR repeat protein
MLEAIANIGNVAVQYQLGAFYQNQKESDKKAVKWLTMASDNGVTDALYRLGVIYEELKEGLSEAIRLYSEAIKRDHEKAMYRLARIYYLGRGVECDYQKAYDLYTRAAELGHKDSSRLLDITNYSIGQHFEDLNNSLSMIKFMAKKGNTDLQYILGVFYMSNKNRLNYNEASKWYQMAISNDHMDAIYQLGLLYENGQGTTPDYSMVYRLHNQAKEKGHRESIYRLGISYQHGLGVTANHSEAIDCYTKAADLGCSESQYTLGKLFDTGELVEKNPLEAYLNGNCDVINFLYRLYDEEPLESFFYERLFKILSNIESVYRSDNNSCDEIYGSLCFKLGMMYLNDQGIETNYTKALKYLLIAYYDCRHEEADPFISLKYNSHTPASQNIYIAKLKAYSKIQDQIPSEHQYKLGMVYYNGIQDVTMNSNIPGNPDLFTILASDYSMAFRYFNQASLKKHPDAQDQLVLMYLRGHGVEKDYQKALEWFTTVSNSTGYFNYYSRGIRFYEGLDVEKDYKIAEIYFQKAIEENDRTQTYLVSIYFDLLEKKQQESKAIEKEIGNIEPGLLHDRGVQLYRESSEGVKNYGLSSLHIRAAAAEKNHKQAIAQMGKMYLDGLAFDKDENEAMRWIQESIEDMNPEGCYEQGMFFYNEKNYRISLLYKEKGAEGNYGDVQAHLGLMYLQGHGVEKYRKQAMRWLQQSITRYGPYGCRKKGVEFYQSVEIDNNYGISLLYFEWGASKNESSAQLGIMYLKGIGIERNHNIAMELHGSL